MDICLIIPIISRYFIVESFSVYNFIMMPEKDVSKKCFLERLRHVTGKVHWKLNPLGGKRGELVNSAVCWFFLSSAFRDFISICACSVLHETTDIPWYYCLTLAMGKIFLGQIQARHLWWVQILFVAGPRQVARMVWGQGMVAIGPIEETPQNKIFFSFIFHGLLCCSKERFITVKVSFPKKHDIMTLIEMEK